MPVERVGDDDRGAMMWWYPGQQGALSDELLRKLLTTPLVNTPNPDGHENKEDGDDAGTCIWG